LVGCFPTTAAKRLLPLQWRYCGPFCSHSCVPALQPAAAVRRRLIELRFVSLPPTGNDSPPVGGHAVEGNGQPQRVWAGRHSSPDRARRVEKIWIGRQGLPGSGRGEAGRRLFSHGRGWRSRALRGPFEGEFTSFEAAPALPGVGKRGARSLCVSLSWRSSLIVSFLSLVFEFRPPFLCAVRRLGTSHVEFVILGVVVVQKRLPRMLSRHLSFVARLVSFAVVRATSPWGTGSEELPGPQGGRFGETRHPGGPRATLSGGAIQGRAHRTPRWQGAWARARKGRLESPVSMPRMSRCCSAAGWRLPSVALVASTTVAPR